RRAGRAGGPTTVSWCAACSGRARLAATTACGSPTPSGRCSRNGCWQIRRRSAPAASSPRTILRRAGTRPTGPTRPAKHALDDPGQQCAGLAMLRRTIREPERWSVGREHILEVTVALDASGCERRDVEIPAPLVAVFDEEPAPALTGAIGSSAFSPAAPAVTAAGSHQHP